MIRKFSVSLECAHCDDGLVRDVDPRLGLNCVVNGVGVDASARERVSR